MFRFTPNRKIVVAGLPEARRAGHLQLVGGDLFQHLNHDGKCVASRFAEEQMNVLGHHDISCDVAAVPTPDSFEFAFESLPRCNGMQKRHPAITTEGYEMLALFVLVTFGLGSHCEGILIPKGIPPSRKNREKGGATPN